MVRWNTMDRKVKLALAAAHMIKPGMGATLAGFILSSLLKIIGPRKSVARKNIELVYPGIPNSERDKLVAESYDNMVWTGLELLALHGSPQKVLDWFEAVEGKEHFDSALEKGRGVIGVSAHIGNWELGAAWIGQHANSAAIARAADSPFQRELIEELRSAENTLIIDKREPMTRAISHLRKNGFLAILSDQHGGGNGLMVPFMGQVTSTVAGAAVFAYFTHAPILPVSIVRIAPFRLKIVFEAPIEWEKGTDRDSTIEDITVKVNLALEKMIKRTPGQWLWQHKRFKDVICG